MNDILCGLSTYSHMGIMKVQISETLPHRTPRSSVEE